jgi:hypothetical protein
MNLAKAKVTEAVANLLDRLPTGTLVRLVVSPRGFRLSARGPGAPGVRVFAPAGPLRKHFPVLQGKMPSWHRKSPCSTVLSATSTYRTSLAMPFG